MVMSCDRKGCKNIMCNRSSHTYGYICDECFEQLKSFNIPIEVLMKLDKRISFPEKDRVDELDAEFEKI